MEPCRSAGPAAIEVSTPAVFSHSKRAAPPIRCYKLNKKRRSYNVVSLSLADGNGRTAAVQQCIHTTATPVGPQTEESSIAFQVELGPRSLLCQLLLVHDEPRLLDADDDRSGSGSGAQYAWRLCSRAQCAKGCEGPLLATSRRLSSLGKRLQDGTPAAAARAAAAKPGLAAAKDQRHMYVSIDEACTHVGASGFRLLAAIYEEVSLAAPTSSGAHSAAGGTASEQGSGGAGATHPQAAGRLLTTAVSPPIKALANNDAPTGAGHIPLEATLPVDWEGWGDLAACASPGAEGRSGDGSLPTAGTPSQSHCLVRHVRSGPSPGPAADSGSAAEAAASAPAADACCAGSVRMDCAAGRAPSPRPACEQAAKGCRPEPLLATAVSATGAAPIVGQPSLGRWAPDADAAAAAMTAARQQRQRARQLALAQSATLPLSLGSRCVDLASQLRAAAAAQQPSSAVPMPAQPAGAAAAPVPGAQAFGASNRDITARVPGGYRVVRPRHLPASSPSPFAARRGSLAGVTGCSGAAGLAVPRAPTPAPWHAAAAPLPAAVECAHSWAELQSSASTRQQGASLLPPEAYEVAAVAPEVLPAATAWPMQPPGPQPASHAAVFCGGSAVAAAVATAGWDAMQWAAFQSAAARQSDAQLVAAGLAAAGRLGLLPSAACRLAPAHQPAPAYQQVHVMQLSAQGGPVQAGSPAAPAGMPDLPSEAQLLNLMGDFPNEADYAMPSWSIFDDILPREH